METIPEQNKKILSYPKRFFNALEKGTDLKVDYNLEIDDLISTLNSVAKSDTFGNLDFCKFYIFNSEIDNNEFLCVLITISIPIQNNSSSTLSQIVMDIVRFIEKKLVKIDIMDFVKSTPQHPNMSCLKIGIKKKTGEVK